MNWERFVIEHGFGARIDHLAFVLDVPSASIERVRRSGACTRRHPATFEELFSAKHGRPPRDDEWPPPFKFGVRQAYEWQTPELVLLASLAGTMSVDALARTLTERLVNVTGDRAAVRTAAAVLCARNRIGLQSGDVLGGITIADATREIGGTSILHDEIAAGRLSARRVGRLWVIPYDAWEQWKSSRVFPPDGFVQLSTLRTRLAIRSDKLSEFCRMGLVPGAIRCNPSGKGAKSTKFGTWYVPPEVAAALLAARRAGEKMPWHGQPLMDNLRATHRLWLQRQHPTTCVACAGIWGEAGAPATFDEYVRRYPPLAHGAKRHLTRLWSEGLSQVEVANEAGCSVRHVGAAAAAGQLQALPGGGPARYTRSDVTRWISRGAPAGERSTSWIAIQTAVNRHGFTEEQVRDFIASGKLASKLGTEGAMRGVEYVSRHQCAALREEIGFTEEEAARKAGVGVERFRELLAGVDWRAAPLIPLSTVQAVIKRKASCSGLTIQQAASELGMTADWVKARIEDGTVRLLRTKWSDGRVYLSAPMLARLRTAIVDGLQPRPLPKGRWLMLSDAAALAGVTTSTVVKWAREGDLEQFLQPDGWRYGNGSVKARARRFWRTQRRTRAVPPGWLDEERAERASRLPGSQPPQAALLTA